MDEIRVVPRTRIWPIVVIGLLVAAMIIVVGWLFFGDAAVVDTRWLQPSTHNSALLMGGRYGTA